MDKPKINDEALRRRVLWNQGDIKAYSQPMAVNSTTTHQKAKERDAIADDVAAFLADGGEITTLEPEDSGYIPGRSTFVISAKNNSNAS